MLAQVLQFLLQKCCFPGKSNNKSGVGSGCNIFVDALVVHSPTVSSLYFPPEVPQSFSQKLQHIAIYQRDRIPINLRFYKVGLSSASYRTKNFSDESQPTPQAPLVAHRDACRGTGSAASPGGYIGSSDTIFRLHVSTQHIHPPHFPRGSFCEGG
jgi:hypothetical protein